MVPTPPLGAQIFIKIKKYIYTLAVQVVAKAPTFTRSLESQIPDPSSQSQIPDPRSQVPDPRSQIPDPAPPKVLKSQLPEAPTISWRYN